MAGGYVANWGNDLNDGLSWETAKRSLQGAKDAGFNPILATGFFNETVNLGITGYRRCILNYSTLSYIVTQKNHVNLVLDNLPSFSQESNTTNLTNCYVRKPQGDIRFASVGIATGAIYNNTVIDSSHLIGLAVKVSNNTVSADTIGLARMIDPLTNTLNILKGNYYELYKSFTLTYSLMFHGQFKIYGGDLGTDETTYEYPTGSDDTEKLQNLRDRMAIVYGGIADDYLVGCRYYSGSYNDVFVDADNGNFYLKNDLNNPALGIGYNGEHAGAKTVAAITTNIATANTLTNINNTTGAITDQNLNASAYWTTIQDAGTVREIASFDAIAEIAYRNGLSINPVEYMSADIIPGSNRLTSGKQYQVRDDNNTGGTIVLDDSGGTILSVWDTFTAVDEGAGAGLGFTSVDNLTVREVDITKYDERIRIKVSTDDATLATANEITMLLHETPLVNVDASNIPTSGNGDTSYDPNTAVPLQLRYMQVWVDIQSDQLFAR